MCTDVCPCYSVEKWELNSVGAKIERVDAEYKFSKLGEEILNSFNRTMQNKTGYEPLIFSKNSEGSYSNFHQCFEKWVDRADKNDPVDLAIVFEDEHLDT